MVPAGILTVAVALATWMINNPAPPEIQTPQTYVPEVEVVRLEPEDYPVLVPSHGIVRPRTQSVLIPQVSGRVDEIMPEFREGGFFEQGDILLRIDSSDYETALVVAESALAQRRTAWELEQAQSQQERENWELMGKAGVPSPLLLRVPQLRGAQAGIEAAEALVAEARRNLSRTEIKAPYAGRVLRKFVDVGQVVTPATRLAEIFAVDYVEVRLPILNEHLDYLDLPHEYRGDPAFEKREWPEVTLQGQYGSGEIRWRGRIVRTEGAFDPQSRQLIVVAQIDDPYSPGETGQPALKINQFVEARIQGKLLQEVFRVPSESVRDQREVIVIGEDHRIQRRSIEILWQEEDYVVVGDNLHEGDSLCLTPLPLAVEGDQVLPRMPGTERAPGGGSQAGPQPANEASSLPSEGAPS